MNTIAPHGFLSTAEVMILLAGMADIMTDTETLVELVKNPNTIINKSPAGNWQFEFVMDEAPSLLHQLEVMGLGKVHQEKNAPEHDELEVPAASITRNHSMLAIPQGIFTLHEENRMFSQDHLSVDHMETFYQFESMDKEIAIYDVNMQNSKGETLLHLAATGATPAAVGYLLAKGATIDIKNKNGDIPYSLEYINRSNVPAAMEACFRMHMANAVSEQHNHALVQRKPGL